jgi:hypothetical protein
MGHDFFFFSQEIFEVPGALTAILIRYDGVLDDSRVIHDQSSSQDFIKRMERVKGDWKFFDLNLVAQMAPHQVLGGWEGRTIYFIKNGQRADQWTPENATQDITKLLHSSAQGTGPAIQWETDHLRELVPVGHEHFQTLEHMVRVTFNFLFRGDLGDGRVQSRTEPENEGIEIRDLLFANKADRGFWKDLKDKYAASEIVVDAKNKDELDRDDLRQLYCYLKPALGFWGFIVCRSPQPPLIHAFNRTLFKNFRQERGLLILSDEDLRRMVSIKNNGNSPASYLHDRMSEFLRSV